MGYNPNIRVIKTPFAYKLSFSRINFFPFFIAMYEEVCIIIFICSASYKLSPERGYEIKIFCKKRILNYSNAFENSWCLSVICYNNFNFICSWIICCPSINFPIDGISRWEKDNFNEKIRSFYGRKGIGTSFSSISGYFSLS